MPYDPATGTFTRVSNSFSDPILGTVIDPTDADLLFDDYDEGLSEVAAWKVDNDNIIGGENAGQDLTTSPANILIGKDAGKDLTTGTGENSVLGNGSTGASMTTATQCSIFGAESGTMITGDTGHSLFGFQAGLSLNSNGQTWNSLFGHISGRLITTGGSNAGFGRGSLGSEVTGSYNAGFGHAALFGGVSMLGVTGFGDSAGAADPAGTANWQATGLTYFGPVNDVSTSYIGRFTGKSTAAARTNSHAIGTLARIPIKDNVMVLGHGLASVETAGGYWDGWTRVDISSTVGLTITAAQMLTGLVVRAGVLAGPVNDTTDTAAAIVAAGPGLNCEVPCSIERSYNNGTTGGFTVTVIGGSGVSVSGLGLGGAVASGATARFRIVITNSTSGAEAISVYRMS